jgi:hypothetical protein
MKSRVRLHTQEFKATMKPETPSYKGLDYKLSA